MLKYDVILRNFRHFYAHVKLMRHSQYSIFDFLNFIHVQFFLGFFYLFLDSGSLRAADRWTVGLHQEQGDGTRSPSRNTRLPQNECDSQATQVRRRTIHTRTGNCVPYVLPFFVKRSTWPVYHNSFYLKIVQTFECNAEQSKFFWGEPL